MNHQPYLDMAFADPENPEEALSAAQIKELRTHLDSCEACRQAASAWDEVEGELRQATLAGPQGGFSARWERRLEARQAQEERRQGYIILGISLGLTAFLLALLVTLAWPLIQSPRLILWAGVYQAVRWISMVSATKQFVNSAVQSVNVPLSLLIWLLAAGLAGALCLAWVVSYRFLLQSGSAVMRK